MLMAQGQVAVVTTWKDAPFFREYFAEHETKKPGEGVSPEAHLLLQVADFLYQIERKVIPNLLKGHTVIMDRAIPTIVIRGLSLGHTLDQLENGLLWFKNTVYRDLFAKATTLYLDVAAGKTLERIKKRSEKEEDGEGTLLSFQMINNLKYLPDGEKLTKKAKRRLVEKLQETYITSYGHYFSHHEGIRIDANPSSEIVFDAIWKTLYPSLTEKTPKTPAKFQISRLKKTK
jgi:thymidylate kinase